MTPRRRAVLFTSVFVVLWATIEALGATWLGRYSPYQVVFTRYVVHLVYMIVIWGVRDPASLVRTRRPVFQMARSFLMFLMPACFVMAVHRGVEARTVLWFFWVSPVLVLALAAVVLRERAGASTWVATAVAGAGAALAIGAGSWPRGALLVFPIGMAVSFSLYVVMTRSLRTETARANLFYTAFGVVLSLSPFVWRHFVTPTVPDFLVMAAIGVLGFYALFALDRMAELAPLTVSAPFFYLQPILVVAIAWGLGHARPGLRVLAGCCSIVLAAAYLWRRDAGMTSAEGVALAVLDP